MARILVIRQGEYPTDPRVHREVSALDAAGHEVDVLCLTQTGAPGFEREGRVTVRRLPLRKTHGGFLRRLLDYAVFLVMAAAVAGALHLRRRYRLVQVNTMPDALVFAALVPKLLGARVLLDLHECMPEFFETKFGTGPRHPAVRLVARIEQAAIRFADHSITCTRLMREAFIARGADPDRVSVLHNNTDEDLYDPSRYPAHERRADRFTLICHGTVEERYGLDTIVRAVALLRDEIPGLGLRVIGNGGYLSELHRLTEELGVGDRVYFSDGFVPLDELVAEIATADAGVVAMKRDAFRDLTLCNKMYDYITMRKPAIVSRTRSVEEYFDASSFLLFTSDDARDLARAIRAVHADPALGARLVEHAAMVNEPYRWPYQRDAYQRMVANIITAGDSSRVTHRQVIESMGGD